MPLSAEQIYNDLSGEDVKQVLLTRFADLLSQVGEFQRHLTLPRVRMNLLVHLEVSGRTPPSFDIKDDLVVRMREVPPLQPGQEETNVNLDLEAEINSDTTTPGGQPPDQIREEHGIPVMEPVKGAFGYQDKPVVREGVRYASFVEQDYGPARQRTGQEGPIVGGPTIGEKNSHGQGGGPIQPDFAEWRKK